MNSGPLLLAVQCLATQEKMLLLAGDSLVLGDTEPEEGKKGGIAGPKMSVPPGSDHYSPRQGTAVRGSHKERWYLE